MTYSTGEGVAQDFAKAARWLRKAAEQGYAEAQCALGILYAAGKGVVQDDTEAVQWFRKAAEQGHAEAQYRLGLAHDSGDGMSAFSVLDVETQHRLRWPYYIGLSVAKNDAEAARWYREAAEQGYGDAQLKLGAMYHAGAGVAQDYVGAYMWLDIAMSTATLDEDKDLAEDVEMIRGIVGTEMTAADISEAKRRARIWLESNYQKCD